MKKPFNEQAAFLIDDALALIKQVLVKHSAAVLEAMHDQIVERNERIAELEKQLNEAVKRSKLQYEESIRLRESVEVAKKVTSQLEADLFALDQAKRGGSGK